MSNIGDFTHPEDGYYMIEAKGVFPNNQAGVVQVIDDMAIRAIVDRFNRDASAGKLPNGKEMLIDHEHFKHDPSKETVAYGWLYQLQARFDGIYGKIRWTATGQAAVDGGDYRFFSTEYNPEDLQSLNGSDKPKRVRPHRLAGLTLTNDPNNKGAAPITNRGEILFHDTGAEKFQIPDVSRWFECVASVRKSLSTSSDRRDPGWKQAWTIAKQQFPDVYNTAFEKVETSLVKSADAAIKNVQTLTNRIQMDSGMDSNAAWLFVREHFPKLFDSQDPAAARLLNRGAGTQPDDSKAICDRAGKLFNRLVAAQQTALGYSTGYAWQSVLNGRPGLAGLANGTLTPEAAFELEPELRRELNA